jgi:tetratricopeptide (TPR) repeat protein
MGDYFSQNAQKAENTEERVDKYDQAIYHYQQAITYSPKSTNYYYALASAYQSIDNIEMVISTLEDSLEFAQQSEIWKIEDNLTHYYVQVNDYNNALLHAQKALATAPESEQERILTIINQLKSSP